MPVRAAFAYKKKIARREYVRVSFAQRRGRRARGDKVSARGRPGCCRHMVDTDGLVELGEQVTLVEPGQTVGFLSYASLI